MRVINRLAPDWITAAEGSTLWSQCPLLVLMRKSLQNSSILQSVDLRVKLPSDIIKLLGHVLITTFSTYIWMIIKELELWFLKGTILSDKPIKGLGVFSIIRNHNGKATICCTRGLSCL